MKIARVVGNVVSTLHSPSFDRRRLLLCDFLDADGRATGKYTIAVDNVDAGPGDTVLILDEGGSARQMLADPKAPIRAVVAGIVDTVSVEAVTVEAVAAEAVTAEAVEAPSTQLSIGNFKAT